MKGEARLGCEGQDARFLPPIPHTVAGTTAL
jgi:hypothetical protein